MSGPRQANLSKMYEPQAVGRSGLVLLLEPVRRLSSHKVVYFGLWQVFRATLRQWACRGPRVQLRSWRSKHTKDPFWHREGLGCMLELRDVTHLVCGRLVVFGAGFILAHTPFCPCLQRFFGSVRRASGHELYRATRTNSFSHYMECRCRQLATCSMAGLAHLQALQLYSWSAGRAPAGKPPPSLHLQALRVRH